MKTAARYLGILGVAVLSIGALPLRATLPSKTAPNGFTITSFQNGQWHSYGKISFDRNFQEKRFVIPQGGSEVRVRIAHDDIGMANLDSIALEVGGQRLSPSRVLSGTHHDRDLFSKLSKQDLDVINVQGRTLEVYFSVPEALLTNQDFALLLFGREEDPEHIPGVPCVYPSTLHPSGTELTSYVYQLGQNLGPLQVDGEMTAQDALGAPVFQSMTHPISGHPEGYTYGYLKNDEHFLYGAIDFTPDNTYDGLVDFGEIRVQTPLGEKAFRVSVGKDRWGKPGFTYTANAPYQHKYYEFKIPLSVLSVRQAQEHLSLTFIAYGTGACGPANDDLTFANGASNPAAGQHFLGNSSKQVVMQQINIASQGGGTGEGHRIKTLTLTGSGSGNEASDIETVGLYHDADGSGTVNAGDVLLGTGTFSADNGTAQITNAQAASAFEIRTAPLNDKDILVVYTLKSSAGNGGTFQSSLANNGDFTLDPSGHCLTAGVIGIPVNGNTMTVLFGAGALAIGSNNPSASTHFFSVTSLPILQFALTATSQEALNFTAVSFTDAGLVSAISRFSNIALYFDANGNGVVNDLEPLLGSYADNNVTISGDKLTFNIAGVSHQVAAGATQNYLLTYTLAAASSSESLASKLQSRLHLLTQGIAALMPLGCGANLTLTVEEEEEEETVLTLGGLEEGFVFTDEEGNEVTGLVEGATVQVRTEAGQPVLQFTLGATAIDLSQTTLERNDTSLFMTLPAEEEGEASVNLSASVSGLPDTLTVFVPCASNDNLLWICPGATSLTENITTCTGALGLSDATATEGYTWENADDTSSGLCEVAGAREKFNSFYGEGVIRIQTQASLAAGADMTLTGVSSSRSITPTLTSVSGPLKTLIFR